MGHGAVPVLDRRVKLDGWGHGSAAGRESAAGYGQVWHDGRAVEEMDGDTVTLQGGRAELESGMWWEFWTELLV